jgi:MFS family permease
LLLGVIGFGAIMGALALRRIGARLGTDRTVAVGSIATALAIGLFAVARTPVIALLASLIAGASWVSVLATLNLSAQIALPDWVRGRGLAIYVMVFFGAITIGSAVWGQLAGWVGLVNALWIAAAGMLLAIALTWRWKLYYQLAIDLTPSMHWPAPQALRLQDTSDGPVMVTVEYHVEEEHRHAFILAVEQLSHERQRDGAYAWAIYEDAERRGRMLETFYVESWAEHMRQHERVTKSDRALQQRIRQLSREEPVVTHLISADSRGAAG